METERDFWTVNKMKLPGHRICCQLGCPSIRGTCVLGLWRADRW